MTNQLNEGGCLSSCLLVSGTILGRRYPEWVLHRVVPCPRIVTEPLVDAVWASRFFSAWECRHDFELTPILHCCFFYRRLAASIKYIFMVSGRDDGDLMLIFDRI